MAAKAESARDYPGLTLAFAVEAAGWRDVGLGSEAALEDFVRQTLVSTAAELGLPRDLRTEVSVTLADDQTVREANAAWRGKDKATNILSFPISDLAPGELPGPLAGDLLVACQTVVDEATAERKTFADHFRHLIVHGFLHLLGYDHEEDADADVMEALEVRILGALDVADPYEDLALPLSGLANGDKLIR